MRNTDGKLPVWVWVIVGVIATLALVFMATTYFAGPPAAQPAPVLPTATMRPTPTVAPTWTPLPTLAPEDQQMRSTSGELGDTIEEGSLVLTAVVSPRLAAASPPAGVRWILLDLTIQNAGGNVVPINSARELILKDDSDQIYKINPNVIVATSGTTPDVDLGPYETIRAQVGYEVPAGASGLVLNFAADKFKAGRVLIAIP